MAAIERRLGLQRKFCPRRAWRRGAGRIRALRAFGMITQASQVSGMRTAAPTAPFEELQQVKKELLDLHQLEGEREAKHAALIAEWDALQPPVVPQEVGLARVSMIASLKGRLPGDAIAAAIRLLWKTAACRAK